MKLKPGFAGSHNIPPAFWDDVTEEEMREVAENDSCLTPRLKERLFRMLDIQNPPPGPIRIELLRSDVERMIAEQQGKAR